MQGEYGHFLELNIRNSERQGGESLNFKRNKRASPKTSSRISGGGEGGSVQTKYPSWEGYGYFLE